jgi:hypothetical protein
MQAEALAAVHAGEAWEEEELASAWNRVAVHGALR